MALQLPAAAGGQPMPQGQPAPLPPPPPTQPRDPRRDALLALLGGVR